MLNSRKILRKEFWASVEKTRNNLKALEEKTNDGDPVSPLQPHREDHSSRGGLWTRLQEAASGMKYPGLLQCFILHCEALPFIPLRNRTIGSRESNPDLDAHLQGDFLPNVFSLIEVYLSGWNLDLDLDGNIFVALLGFLLSETSSSFTQQLGDSLSQIAVSIISSPDGLQHLKSLKSVFPVQAPHSKPHHLAAVKTRLLPFHHDVFNEGFSLIDLPPDSREVIKYGALEFGKDTAFTDKYHWHNAKRHILPKHLGGEPAKPTDDWQRVKMMKRHQRFMSRLTIDAATLTGALGVRFNRLTIISGGTEQAQGKHSKRPVRHRSATPFPWELTRTSQAQADKKPGKKEKPMSSKEKLLAEIAAKKSKKDVDEQRVWWENRLNELSSFDLEKKLRTLTNLERNPRTAGGWLRDEILLYRLHLIICKWIAQINDQDTAAVRDHCTVAVMRIVKELLESKNLTLTVHRVISTVLGVLGFEKFVTPPPGNQSDQPLSFKFVKLVRSKSGRPLHDFMHITEDPITWQLRLFGEFMDRSMGSKPDPRVSFAPDAWQREVLDCLDKNESVLVVGG